MTSSSSGAPTPPGSTAAPKPPKPIDHSAAFKAIVLTIYGLIATTNLFVVCSEYISYTTELYRLANAPMIEPGVSTANMLRGVFAVTALLLPTLVFLSWWMGMAKAEDTRVVKLWIWLGPLVKLNTVALSVATIYVFLELLEKNFLFFACSVGMVLMVPIYGIMSFLDDKSRKQFKDV